MSSSAALTRELALLHSGNVHADLASDAKATTDASPTAVQTSDVAHHEVSDLVGDRNLLWLREQCLKDANLAVLVRDLGLALDVHQQAVISDYDRGIAEFPMTARLLILQMSPAHDPQLSNTASMEQADQHEWLRQNGSDHEKVDRIWITRYPSVQTNPLYVKDGHVHWSRHATDRVISHPELLELDKMGFLSSLITPPHSSRPALLFHMVLSTDALIKLAYLLPATIQQPTRLVAACASEAPTLDPGAADASPIEPEQTVHERKAMNNDNDTSMVDNTGDAKIVTRGSDVPQVTVMPPIRENSSDMAKQSTDNSDAVIASNASQQPDAAGLAVARATSDAGIRVGKQLRGQLPSNKRKPNNASSTTSNEDGTEVVSPSALKKQKSVTDSVSDTDLSASSNGDKLDKAVITHTKLATGADTPNLASTHPPPSSTTTKTAVWTAPSPDSKAVPTSAEATLSGQPRLSTVAVKPATTKPATNKPAAAKPATAKPAAAKPATTKPAAAKPATTKPATKPATAKPATSKPATGNSPNDKPTTAKPAATTTATAKPATPKPLTAQPTTLKPATTKPTITKAMTPKLATSKPATTEPATAKPATAKPATAKPATAKPAIAKLTTTKSATAGAIKKPAMTTQGKTLAPSATSKQVANGNRCLSVNSMQRLRVAQAQAQEEVDLAEGVGQEEEVSAPIEDDLQ